MPTLPHHVAFGVLMLVLTVAFVRLAVEEWNATGARKASLIERQAGLLWCFVAGLAVTLLIDAVLYAG